MVTAVCVMRRGWKDAYIVYLHFFYCCWSNVWNTANWEILHLKDSFNCFMELELLYHDLGGFKSWLAYWDEEIGFVSDDCVV